MADNEKETLYNSDMFDDDLSLIDSEIQAIDSLYDEVKRHYDLVKNSPSRGSLSFVEKQTTNLVNLKTAKLNYIKQRIDAKKSLTDFKYKDKSIDIKQNANDATSQFNEAIYNKIMESMNYNPHSFTSMKSDISDEDDIDEELENSLDEKDLESINSIIKNDTSGSRNQEEETEDEELIQEKEEENVVYDKSNGHFYNIDEDFNIIDDYGDSYDKIVEYYQEGEDEYALSDSDNSYLCVDTSDEEEQEEE